MALKIGNGITRANGRGRDAKVTCRVEFKNRLHTATGTALRDCYAPGAFSSATNPVCHTPQRFYHLRQTNQTGVAPWEAPTDFSCLSTNNPSRRKPGRRGSAVLPSTGRDALLRIPPLPSRLPRRTELANVRTGDAPNKYCAGP